MNQRISFVEGVVIISVAENGQIRIGDTNEIHAFTDILAVQQLKSHFQGSQGDRTESQFQQKEIFFPAFPNEVVKQTFHEQPFIKTGPVRITAVAASSTMHVGSIKHMYGQSRTIHIRQIPEEEEEK